METFNELLKKINVKKLPKLEGNLMGIKIFSDESIPKEEVHFIGKTKVTLKLRLK